MLLQACLNGSRQRGEHAALPLTPAEIAADAARVRRAGAGAVHVHPKDDAGLDVLDARPVAAVVTAVRAGVPGMPVGVTTGAWALPDAADRVEAVRSWTVLPDLASVNWHEEGSEAVATVLLDRGVGVEADCGTPAPWMRGSPHRCAAGVSASWWNCPKGSATRPPMPRPGGCWRDCPVRN